MITYPSADTTCNKSTESASQDSMPNASSPKTTKRLKSDTFPNVLHRMLSEEELGEIITWLPHGCSWKIRNKIRFVDEVIPKFFKHKNFKSFLRQVNGWGFIRINKGPDEGSYYHKSFLRGKSSLVRSIIRPLNFKANNRSEDPPNFALQDEQNTNQSLNYHTQFKSFNQIQSMRRLNSNHSMIQTSDATEDSLQGTSAIITGEHSLQTNILLDLPNSYVPQNANASALLNLLIEHRQRDIKAMLYLEEVKRSNLSFLISKSRNAIFNPILRQGITEHLPPLPPDRLNVLSSLEAMIQNEDIPYFL